MELTIMVFCSVLIIIIIPMTMTIINIAISRTAMKGTDLESEPQYLLCNMYSIHGRE